MQLQFQLAQQQRLKLAMTPELRQSIRVLQLSALDLLAFANEQVAENPVLEWEDRDRKQFWEQKDKISPLDWLEAEQQTLASYLLEQLRFLPLSGMEKKICTYLVGNLNDAGYLDGDIEEIAASLGAGTEEVEAALKQIQRLDPPGVGARNLQECLLLQLQEDGSATVRLARQIVGQHLEDLAQGRIKKMAQSLKTEAHDIQKAVDLIRQLDPKPGSHYISNQVRYVSADVSIEKVEDEYVVIVNDSLVPKLTINTTYQRVLRSAGEMEADAKAYVENKMQAAMWFLRSIEQRRLTLYHVTQTILELQRPFFENGIHYLRPCTMKEVADRIGVHESTVSRTVNQKYVQTPRGLFELRYFFTSALTTDNGGQTSSESVKRLLREHVEQEDKTKPLSDQALAQALEREGVKISRRTVAKYREELGIPSSAQRKRYS